MVERTQEVLGNLVNYEAISGIHPLQPPTIEKADIPKFILCQNFSKSMERVQRTMDRHNNRINDLQVRLGQSQDNIDSLQKALRKVDPGDPPSEPGTFLGPSDTPENIKSYNKEVAEYNDRLQQARRLQERISDAIDKRNDIIERHDDAVREAEEKLEELTEEALLIIDDDIVAVLDKTTQIAIKLSDSETPADVMAAIETYFIELKIFNSFEEHIEGNAARRAAQERIREVNALYAELIVNEKVHNKFVNIFRLNSDSIVKNAELYSQVVNEIKGVDQGMLDELTEPFYAIFRKQFYTSFKYEGIVDPSKLDNVVAEMHNTIDAIKCHIPKVTKLDASTQTAAEAAVVVHQDLESTLATMKANVEEVREYLLSKEDLVCEMLDQEVIEDFYHQDLRPAVTALREEVVDCIGEEQFDAIVTEAEDRYSNEKTEAAIKAADLLLLQTQRDRVAGYVSELSTQIKDVEASVEEAAEVPKRNADGFKSSASWFYAMSCFPVLGFVFAISIRSKIKQFAPAFRSPLEIYHKLGTAILAKNKTMQTVILIFGAVLGFGGMGLLFGTGLSSKIAMSMNISSIAVNLGLPGIVLVLYLVTWVILSSAGKTLQSYIGKSGAAPHVKKL